MTDQISQTVAITEWRPRCWVSYRKHLGQKQISFHGPWWFLSRIPKATRRRLWWSELLSLPHWGDASRVCAKEVLLRFSLAKPRRGLGANTCSAHSRTLPVNRHTAQIKVCYCNTADIMTCCCKWCSIKPSTLYTKPILCWLSTCLPHGCLYVHVAPYH